MTTKQYRIEITWTADQLKVEICVPAHDIADVLKGLDKRLSGTRGEDWTWKLRDVLEE